MKQPAPQETIRNECKNIIDFIQRWEDINKNGCNDPFWSDGCNMNLCDTMDGYEYAEECPDYVKEE